MKTEDPEIKKINSRIEQLFKEWKDLQPLKKEDQERFDKKVRLDWNYNSNHIEGNTLTYNQTETLLIKGKEEGNNPPRDYTEMKAHDLAIDKVKEFSKDRERKLNEVTIRELHKILLKEPFWKEAITSSGQKTQKEIIPGKYKTEPNRVRTEDGKIFEFASPLDVPVKMQELMDWFSKEIKSPILSISSFLAQLHHKFIVIHPFDDGNGRIARLWINYVLLRWGYPPLVIKSEDKRNYFAALQRADHGNINALTIYIGKVLISWLELGIKAAKGQDISQPGDIDKEVTSFIREQKSKGLNKYFSKESAIYLIDNSFDNLVETFKNKFAVFDKLFESTKIEQSIERPNKNFIDFISNFAGRDPELDWTNSDSSFGTDEDPITIYLKASLEDIKKQLELLESPPFSFQDTQFQDTRNDTSYLKIFIELSYNLYLGQKDKELKPFNMDTTLHLGLEKYQYKISIISSTSSMDDVKSKIIIKKYYHQILTQEEINKFIEKGKEDFFNLLKKSAENKPESKFDF